MSFELAVVISFFLLALVGAAAVVRLERAARERREEAMRSEASARGWQFEAADDGIFRLWRWRGVTDAIAWTAEYRRGRHRKGTTHARTHRFVWWADTLRGPASPVLFIGVPRGGEPPAFAVAPGGGGLVARMARKAAGFAFDQAVDVYFGTEAGSQVDAGAMKRIESGTPSGFIVMAADPAEGVRLLLSGWSDALSTQVRDAQSALSDPKRPWVLLLPRRVSLARMSEVTAADVGRFARAGAALVKRT
ncbi:MAG: hypothetical protein AB7Q16_12890 [Vicinamibacterales bacterium]